MAERLAARFVITSRRLERPFAAYRLADELEAALAALREKAREGPGASFQPEAYFQADEYLASNVNPRLVLEQLFISL
jgi:hypothetical protein